MRPHEPNGAYAGGVYYPVDPFTPPSALAGRRNGDLPSSILETLTDEPHDVTLLRDTVMRSWKAMRAAAARVGIALDAVGPFDSYRPLWLQQRIHDQRYYRGSGGCGCHVCGGVTYCKRDCSYATAACPGTSNHGKAAAVDVIRHPGVVNWLLDNAARFGWSWELQSEPWHIRYNPGDRIPAAVLAYEKGIAPTKEVDVRDWAIIRAAGRNPMLVYAVPSRVIGLTRAEADAFIKAGVKAVVVETELRDKMRDAIRS